MKEKIRRFFTSNGALSFYSIFTLVTAFVLVCAIVLFTLSKAGLFTFPSFGRQEQSNPITSDFGDINYEYYTEDAQSALPLLLSSYPFNDRFRMTVYIMYATSDGLSQSVCDIAKSGDCYKLITRNDNSDIVEIVMCDGKTVSFLSASGELIACYPYSDAYAFENMVYAPSFCLLDEEAFTLKSYSYSAKEITVTYDIPSLSYEEEVYIDAETGIVTSVRTYCENRLICRFDVSDYSLNFSFSEDAFTLPDNSQQD